MDHDLTHEAIARFEALEARVTALEGSQQGAPVGEDGEGEGEDDQEEETEETTDDDTIYVPSA